MAKLALSGRAREAVFDPGRPPERLSPPVFLQALNLSSVTAVGKSSHGPTR